MKKLDWKTCGKIAVTVFAIYLAIHYWTHAASLMKTLIAAILPLIIGLIIAYPINILMSFYERNLLKKSKKPNAPKVRQTLGFLLSILTVTAILALVICLVVPQLTECVKLLIAKLPRLFSLTVEKINSWDFTPEKLSSYLSTIDWQSKVSELIDKASSGIGNVITVIIATLTSVVSGIATVILAIIFAIYLLLSKDKLIAQVKLLSKRYLPQKFLDKADYVLSIANDSFKKFIVAQCTEAIILGVLVTVGMLIFRFPYAPMIGAVSAVCAFVPVVGAFVAGGIGFVLILTESPTKALFFILFIVIVQQIEGNLIYPKVMGNSIGLPGFWVLVAITIGGGMFGVMGIILSVPIASTIYRIIKDDIKKKIAPPVQAE
jgi:predicted PurR-regulated permease PerM